MEAKVSPSPSCVSPIESWLGKVHQGDCIELMNRMPSESVDLIVTSPPYNIKNSTGNGLKNGSGGKWTQAELIKGYASHDDAMPHEEYVAWQRNCLQAMMRVLRDGGAIFYNHKWRVQGGLLQDRADIVDGFPMLDKSSFGNETAVSTLTPVTSCLLTKLSI